MAFYLSKAVAYSTSRSVCLRSPKLIIFGTERVQSGLLRVLTLPPTVHLSGRYLSSSCTKFLPCGSKDSGSFLTEDIAKPERHVKVLRRDQRIIQQISQFSSTSRLLSFLETVDTSELDHRAIEVISTVLFGKLKNEPYQSRKKLLKSVGMQIYCHRILKTRRTMDGRLLITLIKLFVFMGADGNHKTFQKLLRLISEQASTLDLSKIVFLNFLIASLRAEQTSTLSEAIRVALPEVFERQASLQQNDDGPKVLIRCLAFSLFTKCGDGTLTQIIDKILSLRQSDFNLAQAVDIHKFCAGHWLPIPRLRSLLELSYGIFTANIQMINGNKMRLILGRSASRVIRGHLEFYHEDFFDACCNRLSDSRDEIHVLRCLAPMSILRHVSIDFLERCAEIVARAPQRIFNDDSLYFALIRGFSCAGYKPENWNILVPMLLEHPATTGDMSNQEVNLILDFLTLDTLPLNLLVRVSSPDYFDRLLEKSGPYALTVVYAAIKQLYPEYSGPLPPKSMIDAWQEARRKHSVTFRHPLEGSFVTALGGESYILTGLTHEGIHIDHCIVMRKGGYPVALQQCQYSCLDEIERPTDSALVLVKVFAMDAYSLNTRSLRGIHSIECKILKSFGHPVVEVDLTTWRDLREAEKIPYLVQKVKENVDDIQI